MGAITYHHSPNLPWTDNPRDAHRFQRILAAALILFFLFSVMMQYIDVPKVERPKNEPVPERLARMIIEHKKLQRPPPPPKPIEPNQPEAKAPTPEKVQPKVKEELPPPPKTELKVEPDLEAIARMEQQQREAEIAAARKKAASTGLLALSNDLVALRDKPVVPNPAIEDKLIGSGPSKQETVVQRAMITSGVAATRGAGIGINTSNLSKGVSGSGLSDRATTRVNAPKMLTATSEAPGKSASAAKAPGQKALRTDAEIQLVFDKNKSALYSLYNRALRQDPTLQGKVVLKITIDPSGSVNSCEVVSSEMNAPELIQKIVARVLMFDFGSKDVALTITTFPIDFLPTS